MKRTIKRTILSDSNKANIAKEYDSGAKYAAIVRKYKISRERLKGVLKEHNVRILLMIMRRTILISKR